MSLIYTFYLIW